MATSLPTWDAADTCELASLTFDSFSSASATVRGVRSASSWRQLSFRASGLTIELSVTATGPTRRLMGQLLPRQPAQVDIRYGETLLTIEADDLGRFSADDIPAGQISIRCRLGASGGPGAGGSGGSGPGGSGGSGEEPPPPVVTGWISI